MYPVPCTATSPILFAPELAIISPPVLNITFTAPPVPGPPTDVILYAWTRVEEPPSLIAVEIGKLAAAPPTVAPVKANVVVVSSLPAN